MELTASTVGAGASHMGCSSRWGPPCNLMPLVGLLLVDSRGVQVRRDESVVEELHGVQVRAPGAARAASQARQHC
jgi:hypothetical protein